MIRAAVDWLQVWVPGVDATFGCVEFEALMGIIWDNMGEACSFEPHARPPIPIGRRLPPAGPQPRVLGVDRSIPPNWQLEVNVGVIGVAVGGVPRAASLGSGPALAKVSIPFPIPIPYCISALLLLLLHAFPAREG